MAMTIDPETGGITTTFLLECRKKERERQKTIQEWDRAVMMDAMRWRALPEEVRTQLIKKHGL